MLAVNVRSLGTTNLFIAQILHSENSDLLTGDSVDYSVLEDGINPVKRLAAKLINPAIPDGFVFVEGGTFQMGSNIDRDFAKPVHTVTVSSFYISKYEVTQKEWREVMGTTIRQENDMYYQEIIRTCEAKLYGGSEDYEGQFRDLKRYIEASYKDLKEGTLLGVGDTHPMYCVSWYETVEYCNRRSIKEGLTPVYRRSKDTIICDWTANGYRLLTEAEWEYAAKGDRNLYNYTYSGSNDADIVAWHVGNSGGTTHPVGMKQPNSLGIYDMSGNVEEWCWDLFGLYSGGSQTDPWGPSQPDAINMRTFGLRNNPLSEPRIIRGGAVDGSPLQSITKRGIDDASQKRPRTGFRLARSSL